MNKSPQTLPVQQQQVYTQSNGQVVFEQPPPINQFQHPQMISQIQNQQIFNQNLPIQGGLTP